MNEKLLFQENVSRETMKGGVIMDWKRKLTSRKLWVSIASFISLLIVAFGYSEHAASEVAAIIMAGASIIGYVIGEGLVDASSSTITHHITTKDTDSEDNSNEV